MDKKYGQYGKAHQREDREDRAASFKDWVRSISDGANGIFLDLDLLKWRETENGWRPVAILDLTRCDTDHVGMAYLQAVERNRLNSTQGQVIRDMAKFLGIPAYYIVNHYRCDWFYVFSFQRNEWKQFSPEEWAERMRAM